MYTAYCASESNDDDMGLRLEDNESVNDVILLETSDSHDTDRCSDYVTGASDEQSNSPETTLTIMPANHIVNNHQLEHIHQSEQNTVH